MFASRYGWTKDYVLALPVFDFLGYLSAARKRERDEMTQDLKASAFTGWQIYTLVESIFKSGKDQTDPLTYNEWLEGLNLLSKEEKKQLEMFRIVKRHQQKQQAKENINKAANIIELHKRSRKGGGS